MPRREIISPAQREALLVIPVDRAGLIEHYVLGEQDISLIRQHLNLKQFDRVTHRKMAKWLLAVAMQATQGIVLAQALIEELRRCRIVLPSVSVIGRLCAEVATRAQRHVHRALTESLTDEQRRKLDQLLESRDVGSQSLLAWLRLPQVLLAIAYTNND
jgi:Domain of unknown function (DUF4158)